MNSKYRRSVFALGSCALLLAPLGAIAQVATDAKPADAKQTDPAPAAETYTLRLKFKQGDVSRYKTQIKSTTVTPAGLGSESKTIDATTDIVSEQKTTKLLDNGGAEIVTTLTNVVMNTGDKDTESPKLAPITQQITAGAKVLSTKSAEDASSDALKSVFTSSFSTPQSFLPDTAVKVGDKWTQKLTLSSALGGKEGTVDCSFVRIETVNGVKTALIHAIMKAPIFTMITAMGQPTKVEGDAAAVLEGPFDSDTDIYFAIDEGRIAKTTGSSNIALAIKPGKGLPPELAGLLPEGSKITMKSNAKMNLLAPGEKVTPPKTTETTPETVKPETPDKK